MDSATLITAAGFGTDPLKRQTYPPPILPIGYPNQVVGKAPALQERLSRLRDDKATWELPLRDPRFVLVDQFYGSQGGPRASR